MHPHTIIDQSPADLRPDPLNPREHPPGQIRRLVKAIRDFGFTQPIIVDTDNVVIAGHARLQAAQSVPLKTVPTIKISGLSQVQRRALALADNRLFEDGKWNPQKLATVFEEILKIDATFDLESTGFSVPEIDLIIGADGSAEAVDRLPLFDTGRSPVARIGDLWTLGHHRLLAGDARDSAAFQVLMNQQRARTVIADSPYNIEIPGFVSKLPHKNFQMGCGEMTPLEFTSFITEIMRNAVAHSVDGAVGFWFIDWRHLREMLAAGYATHTELLNLCVWAKNPGQGSFYRSTHELIAVWKSGKARHVNNVAGGKWSRSRNNIWQYPSANVNGSDCNQLLRDHPTPKPVALIQDAILDCSKRDEIVLDPFSGSGATIIAAEKAMRRAFAMEIEPRFVDLAIRRWQNLTGKAAVHAEQKKSFAEVEATRASLDIKKAAS